MLEPITEVSSEIFRVKSYLPFLDLAPYFVLTVVLYLLLEWLPSTSPKRRKAYKYLQKFATPPTLPFLGNGHQMLFKPTEFYKWSENLIKTWGKQDMVITWRLNFPMLWLANLDISLELLQNPNFVNKSKDIELLYGQPGGNGLSGAPTPIHNPRRKLLYPGYSRQVVDKSVPVFWQETRNLISRLENLNSETIEIVEVTMPASFRVMCRTALGDKQFATRNDKEALDHMKALHVVSVNFTNRLMSPFLWLRNDFIYFNFTEEGKNTRKMIKIINDFGLEAIEKRKEERRKGIQGTDCYLDMLLDFEEKGDLKESDILGELNNYIVAGYDTTALAVIWTLFALAVHESKFQDKICDEIDTVFGRGPVEEWEVTPQKIKELKYLELCIKEAMRLYPTSPVTPRNVGDKDIQLKDGRVLPAYTDVMIMVNMLHRDKRYWERAEEFWPERHVERNLAFMPFSAGARTCVGQGFGMMLVKIELAGLIKSFRWATEEKWESLNCVFQALLVPAEGLHFKITKR